MRRFFLLFMLLLSFSVVSAAHPQLLFDAADVPVVQQRIQSDPRSAEVYQYIYDRSSGILPQTHAQYSANYGLHTMNLLASAYAFSPQNDPYHDDFGLKCRDILVDFATYEFGLMDSCGGADNYYYESELLYALNIGYDLCFDQLSAAEATQVRTAILTLVQYGLDNCDWLTAPPGVPNKAAMPAGMFGLSYLNLRDDVSSSELAVLTQAKAWADGTIQDHILPNAFGSQGEFSEGILYELWTYRFLIPYFESLERLEGYSYYEEYPLIRESIVFLLYNVLPEGHARTNNINDAEDTGKPLGYHNTYVDWMVHKGGDSKYGSLAFWLWEHIFGQYRGYSSRVINSDSLSSLLWYDSDHVLENPSTYLPSSEYFVDGGWYAFRTGWQDDISSEDVLIELYLGSKFFGGHAQEDKGQFTFAQGKARFFEDSGPSTDTYPDLYKTENHNLITIDGKGMVYQANNCGSDAAVTQFMTSPVADFIRDNTTFSYNAYSEFCLDQTWCTNVIPYTVQHSFRNALVVKEFSGLPYLVVFDDIKKDEVLREYTLNVQFPRYNLNVLDVAENSVTHLTHFTHSLDFHYLYPTLSSLTVTQGDNPVTNQRENSIIDRQGRFFYLALPHASQNAVQTLVVANGLGVSITNGTVQDVIMVRTGVGLASYADISFDAHMVFLRYVGGVLESFSLFDGSSLSVGGILLVSVSPAASAFSDGAVAFINDVDAQYLIYGPSVTQVFADDLELSFTRQGEYIVPGDEFVCADEDGDQYGSPPNSCSHPEEDCDDTDPFVNPGASEVCDNGKDDDCNGQVDLDDEACSFLVPYDLDADGLVGLKDFLLVASDFHQTPGSYAGGSSDLNGDGRVDIVDLVLVANVMQ